MLTPFKRPYVILNVPMTADGKTDTVSRSGTRISSKEDLKRVDKLRAEMDAVMVGGRTLLENDPRLTVKAERLRQEHLQRGLSPNPIKVGMVTRANLRPDSRFLNAGPARMIIFTTTQSDPDQIDRLEKQEVQVFVLGDEQVDLVLSMQKLMELGVQRLLVEGGGRLNELLLRLRLVDEMSIYVAPLIFGGMNAPTFVSGAGLHQKEAIRLKLKDVIRLEEGGILLRYLPEYEQEKVYL